MDLPPPNNELNSLRSYVAKIEMYSKGLESLGQSENLYGSLLGLLLVPVVARRNKERYSPQNGSDVTLTNLRKALEKEVDILEVGHPVAVIENNATVTFYAGN